MRNLFSAKTAQALSLTALTIFNANIVAHDDVSPETGAGPETVPTESAKSRGRFIRHEHGRRDPETGECVDSSLHDHNKGYGWKDSGDEALYAHKHTPLTDKEGNAVYENVPDVSGSGKTQNVPKFLSHDPESGVEFCVPEQEEEQAPQPDIQLDMVRRGQETVLFRKDGIAAILPVQDGPGGPA